jgi:predicted transcriptional regulator
MLLRDLGQLESAVMQRLWSWDRPVLVREVLEDLQRDRSIAYTTVMTVMDNLHRKGVLSRERQGRAYVYRPARSREEHTAAVMEEVLATSSDPAATLMHFVGHLNRREVARLRKALDGKAPPRGKRTQ